MTCLFSAFPRQGREDVLMRRERPFGDIRERNAQTRRLQACGGAHLERASRRPDCAARRLPDKHTCGHSAPAPASLAALTTVCPHLPAPRWPSQTRGDLFKQQRALGVPGLEPPFHCSLPSPKMLESLIFFFFSVQLSFFGAMSQQIQFCHLPTSENPPGSGEWLWWGVTTRCPGAWACSGLLPGRGSLPPPCSNLSLSAPSVL